MKLVEPADLFRKLLNRSKIGNGRLLGLDVGNKYVGLAVSNHCNETASPLSVLVRKKTNINLMAKDFQTLVREFSLVGLVVGCPFDLQGSPNLDAVVVRLFVDDLRNTGQLDDLSYTYWDERFTSKCVEALTRPLNLHHVASKTIVDKFAAVGILQGYLDHVRRNADLEKSES